MNVCVINSCVPVPPSLLRLPTLLPTLLLSGCNLRSCFGAQSAPFMWFLIVQQVPRLLQLGNLRVNRNHDLFCAQVFPSKEKGQIEILPLPFFGNQLLTTLTQLRFTGWSASLDTLGNKFARGLTSFASADVERRAHISLSHR